MTRCHGNTKSGSRCKRTIAEDERYCSLHAGQATDEPEESAESETGCESLCDTDSLDALLALAVGGALIVAAIAFRRVIRIF